MCAAVVDEEFGHPRLAALYDLLDPDRGDLDAYVGIADELGARRVLDVGCGTGRLALFLADRGRDEVAADLAAAGYGVDDVRGAPDRPGLELVVLARRP
jgi:2-polyprenyl-3-methyl-5-hydroxy-6-metoxy-1,4-benzoquinol methylase